MRVEPVAEISGNRRSSSIGSPTLLTSPVSIEKTSAKSYLRRTVLAMLCTATALSGVSSDGFQITVSPQTAAISAFHAQTATGKLNALITPTGPSGCHCS